MGESSRDMRYKYETQPYQHQQNVLNESWNKDDWALFLEMGTGKSKIAIDNAAMLYDQGKIDGIFIVAPKSMYLNWAEEEIPIHMPKRIPVKIGVYESGGGQAKVKAVERLFEPSEDLHILLMNVEALATKNGNNLAERFLGSHQTFFIIDESTTIKNYKAQRTKAALRLGNYAVYRRILSGAPVVQSPLDLYSQCAFLDPHLLGFSSYYAFRSRYAVLKQMHVGPKSFKSIVGYKNLDELSEKIKMFSSRIRKQDCLDLPPKVYETRRIALTEEQEYHYENLRKYAITEIEGNKTSARLILTQLQKLHQVCCGFLKTDDYPKPWGMESGKLIALDNRRELALLEILHETSGKAIIWCYYRFNIQNLLARIRLEFGAHSVAAYYGETTTKERPEIVKKFQDMESPLRFLVGQTGTGGRGLTLTAADLVIYYSNSYSLEDRIQSEDRAHRAGQDRKVTYIDLISPGTVDDKIVKVLKKKQNIADLVVDDGWRTFI